MLVEKILLKLFQTKKWKSPVKNLTLASFQSMHPYPMEAKCLCFMTLLISNKFNGLQSLWLLKLLLTQNCFTCRSDHGTLWILRYFTLKECLWQFTTTFTQSDKMQQTLWSMNSQALVFGCARVSAILWEDSMRWNSMRIWLKNWDAKILTTCA